MIELYLGNVGAGKTLSAIHSLISNPPRHKVFSNIMPKSDKLRRIITPIKKDNIITTRDKKIITRRANAKGEIKESVRYKQETVLNVEFWKSQPKPLTIILDEAHTLLNPRRSMSNINKVMGDFIALLRRVIGSVTAEYGKLILITQLERRIDVIVREMTNVINYHIFHIDFLCSKCNVKFHYTNEYPEYPTECPFCNGHDLSKHNQLIEVLKFKGFDSFNSYKDYGSKTYYSRYLIVDVEKLFEHYDTMQFEEMFSI